MLTAIDWPKQAAGARFCFVEFAVREGDFAIVAVAVAFDARTGNLRLGFGGCGETPQIVAMTGIKMLDAGAIESIAQDAPARLEYRSDLLAAADYRRHLATTLARQALTAAVQEAAHA